MDDDVADTNQGKRCSDQCISPAEPVSGVEHVDAGKDLEGEEIEEIDCDKACESPSPSYQR